MLTGFGLLCSLLVATEINWRWLKVRSPLVATHDTATVDVFALLSGVPRWLASSKDLRSVEIRVCQRIGKCQAAIFLEKYRAVYAAGDK